MKTLVQDRNVCQFTRGKFVHVITTIKIVIGKTKMFLPILTYDIKASSYPPNLPDNVRGVKLKETVW